MRVDQVQTFCDLLMYVWGWDRETAYWSLRPLINNAAGRETYLRVKLVRNAVWSAASADHLAASADHPAGFAASDRLPDVSRAQIFNLGNELLELVSSARAAEFRREVRARFAMGEFFPPEGG